MNNRKYPNRLFVIGFFSNLFLRFCWLFVPSVVLLIVGIFVKPCLYIGGIIFFIDVILSLVEQIKIRKTFIEESDNPDFKRFQDALSKDGDWIENVKSFVEQQTSDPKNQIETENENN